MSDIDGISHTFSYLLSLHAQQVALVQVAC